MARGGALRVTLTLALLSTCYSPQPASAQPLPERRPFKGRLVTPENTPITGATITIKQQLDVAMATFWGDRVATNANGEFAFRDAEDGLYHISISVNGFAPMQGKPFIIDSNTISPTIIKMERLATLSMHFIKTDNNPVSGKPVAVLLTPAGAPQLPLMRVTADVNGNATLPGLIPGLYKIQTLSDGIGSASMPSIEIRYAAEPKPIDIKLQAGGTLSIIAKEAQGDKAAKPIGGAAITFTAAPAGGEAPKQANPNVLPDEMVIYAQQAQQAGNASLVTREGDGTMQLADIAPGSYTIRLYSQAHKTAAAKTVEVKAGETATVDFLVEALAPPVSYDIIVKDSKGKPIADKDFVVHLRPTPPATFAGGAAPPAPDVPAAVRNLFGNGVFMRRGKTDKDGKLTLYPMQAGKTRIVLMAPGTADGGATSAATDVTIEAAGGSTNMQIALPEAK